jgi:hypothetical protein
VITAAALIASFLGAATIRQHNRLGPLTILALVVLVMTGSLSLHVLWPRELRFAVDARATYEGSLTRGEGLDEQARLSARSIQLFGALAPGCS